MALDGTPIEGVPTLQRLMVAELIGTTATFTIVRNDELLEITLVASELAA